MNTETHIYNYSSCADPETKATLTQRLYPATHETSSYAMQSSIKDKPTSTFDTVKHMIDLDAMTARMPMSKRSISDQSLVIDQTIQDYHDFQSAQLSNYLEKWLKRPPLEDHFLQLFHGWGESREHLHGSFESSAISYGDISPKATGGFYLRWNNTGIAINPGKNFMRYFHRAGLHIKDIDIVLATSEEADTYTDIQEIQELNLRLNRASGDQQIIHYYLNQKAYRELSTLLRPNSKLERNAIHCLEFFAESPEIEQAKLGNGILLHYFILQPQFSLASNSARFHQPARSNLGIRLELSKSHLHESPNINLGYISNEGWSPFIGQHLTKCDILLAGIGNTNQSDYNKIIHLNECLGYYGACSLLEETFPKLLICTEFSSKEGDLRLEIIKKMRAEYSDRSTVVLPGDIGMCINLISLAVRCSLTHKYIKPDEIKVIRSSELFGLLQYLTPAHYL